MMTGTGTPFKQVGVYCHCLTASIAAASGAESTAGRALPARGRRGRWSLPDHDACTRADCASAGTPAALGLSSEAESRRRRRTGAGEAAGAEALRYAPGMPPTTPRYRQSPSRRALARRRDRFRLIRKALSGALRDRPITGLGGALAVAAVGEGVGGVRPELCGLRTRHHLRRRR